MLPELVASLALAGASPAQCPAPPPEPPRLTPVREAVEHRKSFGFRADRPYVRKLIRRGVWEYDVGYMPVTPRENVYLRLRDRLELGGKVARYLRERPDLSGGVSVEDDWPREPYVLLRVTEDPALHEAALRELARFPDNLRLVRVEHSYRTLKRLANAVEFEGHEADGFFVMGVGPDITGNRVDLEVITERTDAEAYFAAAYGPLVRTRVIATSLTEEECAAIYGYKLSDGGRRLRLTYESGGGAELSRVVVSESRTRVRVGVVQDVPTGFRTDDLRTGRRAVRLERPLGDRIVVNALDGERIRPLRRQVILGAPPR